MPNLDPWINQNEEHMGTTKTITNNFENHLLSIRDDRQKMIHPSIISAYNNSLNKMLNYEISMFI
jgi:hypothetical protein